MQCRQIDLIILIIVSILTLSYTTVYYQVASVTVPNSEKTSFYSIRCQMISEARLVRLLDMNPFSIPKLRQHHNLPVCLKTALAVWQVTAVYNLIALLYEMTVSDVETFVWKLSCTLILFFTLISIYLILSTSRDRRFNFEKISELNSFLDLTKSTQNVDGFIPVIVSLLVAHVSSFTFLSIPNEIVFLINYMIFVSTTYTVSGTKHLVSKSMKAVIEKMIQSESPINIALHLRQALLRNQRIEDKYSFSVLVGLSNGIFMILISLTTFWNVYGLHKICDCFESNHPLISIVSQYYAMFQLTLLGIVSTKQLSYVSRSRFPYRICK